MLPCCEGQGTYHPLKGTKLMPAMCKKFMDELIRWSDYDGIYPLRHKTQINNIFWYAALLRGTGDLSSPKRHKTHIDKILDMLRRDRGLRSRNEVTRARDLAPAAFRRRNFSGISRRRMAVGSFQLSLNRDGPLVFPARLASRTRRTEGRGESPARNRGRCALIASQENGPPMPAAFPLAP